MDRTWIYWESNDGNEWEGFLNRLYLDSWKNYIYGVLKIGDPQVTIGFNTRSWSNDSDDLGDPQF